MSLIDGSLPAKVDTQAAKVGKDESLLIDNLLELRDEGEDYKKKVAPQVDDEDALRLYRGESRPQGRDTYYSCDFIQTFIDRNVARLTDNRPILRVDNKKASLRATAIALGKVMQGVWQECDMQRQTFKMCHNAAVRRSAGMYVGYDGDEPYIEMLTKDQVTFDPQVKEAALISKGEYVIIERIKTISELQRRFPGRGALVKPDDIIFKAGDSHSGVKSPVQSITKRFGTKGLKSSVIPRAKVYEAFVKDRQQAANGDDLFPFGRRIIYTKDMVLWDGPIPRWDGQVPIDWFDWTTDPEHVYGLSAPMALKRLQAGFNELLDGTVTNVILSNFISIISDPDTLDAAQWKNLQKITNSLILRKTSQNKTLQVTPPISFGLDKMQIAKQLFTYAQLIMGETDVQMGDQPGSLQSGIAVEGLQEAANLMTRARASRLEDFYGRVGAKLMSSILQWWPSDRVFHLLGPTGESIDYSLNRAELFMDMSDPSNPRPLDAKTRQEAFKYMRFSVLPGSSAPGTRARRAQQAMMLNGAGMADRKYVLESADFQNPEQMLIDAEKDFAKFPPAGFKRVPQGDK